MIPHLGLYRRGTAAAFVLAPGLFLVDNLIHPEEFAHDHEAEQLAEIAENYTAWQVAHFIGFAAIVCFAAAVLGLAFLVRRRRPGFGLVAGAAAVAGLLALAAVIVLDGYTWGVLGEVYARSGVHPGTVELALHDIQQSEWSLPYYMGTLGWGLGMIALAVGAWRAGALSALPALLFSLGVVMVGIETEIPDTTYFIAAAAVLFAGGVAVALELWRMSDEEFAGAGAGSAGGDLVAGA